MVLKKEWSPLSPHRKPKKKRKGGVEKKAKKSQK